MSHSKGKISRREFLKVSAALPVCLAISFSKGHVADPEDHFASPPQGYDSGAYGSGPYGIDSYNLYLPAVNKGGG